MIAASVGARAPAGVTGYGCTGQVYECPLGWYDDYDRNRGSYDMSDLQPLPDDDWAFWMSAAIDGHGNIH